MDLGPKSRQPYEVTGDQKTIHGRETVTTYVIIYFT